MHHGPPQAVERLRRALATSNLERICILLHQNGAALLAQGQNELILEAVQILKHGSPELEAALILLAAQAWLGQGDLVQALHTAESARRAFDLAGDIAGELQSCLLLARIHHRSEDLGAAHLYTEEAAELLRRYPALPAAVQADAYLGLARLAPDVGQLRQGLHFARQALHYFDLSRDVNGQVDAFLLLSGISRQMGRLQEGAAYLEMARRRFPQTGQAPWRWASLLNGEIHDHWSRGNFAAAAETARLAIGHADSQDLAKFRVYQRLALANVLRCWGRWAEAEAAYAETESVIAKTGFALFQVWVDANWAWLDVLQQNYAAARRRLFAALATTDRGQAASFNVCLAGLYSLTGRYTEATTLLQRSLHFYQTSGDELSIFALRFHLAYVYLQRGQTAYAEEEMALGLGWAAEWNVDYFPHWWHPQIVAAVCAHAFVAELHPGLAERIFVRRLGETALPALQPLLRHGAAAVRQRAADALSLLNIESLTYLTGNSDDPASRVLSDLVASGKLQVACLPALAALLSTTRRPDAANPVLLATFGLYLQGAGRRDIAAALGRSEKTIRNYITVIYDRFGLPDGGDRRDRRQELRQLALAAGYIGA